MLKNIHPGEILLEEFLKEYGISQNRLGREIGMSPRAINEIVHGKRSVTANSALRLAKFFGTSAKFWLNLQRATTWKKHPDQSIFGTSKVFKRLDGICPCGLSLFLWQAVGEIFRA